jgi:hypothetical protein
MPALYLDFQALSSAFSTRRNFSGNRYTQV